MLTESPPVSWIRRARLLADSRRHALLAQPFVRLTGHFAKLLSHSQESDAAELEQSIGGLLALLAAPGGFLSLFLLDKYNSLKRFFLHHPEVDPYTVSLPDKYFFLVFSMVAAGMVVAIKWDRILPDRRDYVNLAALPIPARQVFLANACAILLLAAVFTLDVNAVSSFLFPMVATAERGTFMDFASFVAVHWIAVLAASAFAFLACFAAMSGLMALLPACWFRSVSLYVRVAIIGLLLTLLASSFAVPAHVQNLPAHSGLPVRWLPPVWFLGLYQWMQGRAGPGLIEAARLGLQATGVAFALALAGGELAYWRHYRRIPEMSEGPAGRAPWIRWEALADRWFATPFRRGVYRFTLKTLLRSEAHCLVFGGFGGMGLVLASQQLMSGTAAAMLSIPMFLSYFVLSGLRAAFEIPAGMESAWLFRMTIDPRQHESVRVARAVALTFLLPCVAAPVLIVHWRTQGFETAAAHVCWVLGWSLVLFDVFFAGYRKIPFACSLPGFRNHSIVLALGWMLGCWACCVVGGGVELWMLSRPVRLWWLPVMLGMAEIAIRKLTEEMRDEDQSLVFQAAAGDAVQLLNLTD